jgi:dephospho-CoA kinase
LADGRLDRAALARRAFATDEATRRLNAIVHPAVAREIGVSLDQLRLLPEPPLALALEVPLLAEAPVFAEIADVALAIVAPENVRIARAVSAGMTEDEARRRVSRQASDAQRAALADAVIINDGSKGDFIDALGAFWREYVAPVGPA